MFERYTERARNVFALAEEEARGDELRHNYVGTEHLLREAEGLAARALESLDVTPERVRRQIVRIVGAGDGVAGGGEIPFTPRVRQVLAATEREGRELSHQYIGTEHILLGLTRVTHGVAVRILRDFDADPAQIRDLVIRMLTVSMSQHRAQRGAAQRQAGTRHDGET